MVDAAQTDLWGTERIPILAVTGERFSGRTLLVSSIHPLETLMIDLNRSSETYSIPYKRRFDPYSDWQAQDVLAAGDHPQRPGAVDIFLWFRRTCEAIQPGQYAVLAVDPIMDIEAGLADWMQQNPHESGRTAQQYARCPELLQTDMVNWWKTFLTQLSTKVQTIAFTADTSRCQASASSAGNNPLPAADHHNDATDTIDTPDTLFDLATLHLHTERRPTLSGRVNGAPAARVLKSRLARTTTRGSDVQHLPILPPYLKVATPNTLRKYIRRPADYSKLKKSERIPQDALSIA